GVVASVAFTPDGKRVVAGGCGVGVKRRQARQEVKVCAAHTRQETRTLQGHAGPVMSVAFSADGKRIASGSGDKTVKVWDAHTGQEQLTLMGHCRRVYSVAFSADGKRIAAGGNSKTVEVWDAQTGQEILTLKGHTKDVSSV